MLGFSGNKRFKKEIAALREKVRQAQKIIKEKDQLIADMAAELPEVRSLLLRLETAELTETNKHQESNTEPADGVPEELPSIIYPNGEKIFYSQRFINHFGNLTPTAKKGVAESINFLSKNGKEHRGFKAFPLKKKMFGIDPHNCFRINSRKNNVMIIYQNLAEGIKFREVRHYG